MTHLLPTRLVRALSAVAVVLLTTPVALASTAAAGGGGGLAADSAEGRLAGFLQSIQELFTGPIGTSIGIIAFAAAGIYVMYARQTGQAVGAIAKVFVGLLILFGGTALVGVASGAAF